jgi:hypothetical protein
MRRRLCSPAAPLDDDDLLREILLRLPPQPCSLPRASLVCTRWRGVLSDPQFLDRFRKRHRKPPLLGCFTGEIGKRHVFVPALGSADRNPPAERFPVPRSCKSYDRWDFRGCRHGLAVLVNDRGREAVVWDPLTGQRRRHRVPFRPGLCGSISETFWLWHPAVMCADAEDGHVHGDCFASPFKFILMCQGPTQAFTCVYSSASGMWGNVISTATAHRVLSRPGVLVGNSVYWLFRGGGGVLVFDFETQSLGVIDKPADVHGADWWCAQLLRAGDDGSLGLADLSMASIQLWKRQSNSYGVVEWVLMRKTIQLEGLFPGRTIFKDAFMVGYDEDSNEIVLASLSGVIMLQIGSMKVRTVYKRYSVDNKIFYPYRNFYTAGNTSCVTMFIPITIGMWLLQVIDLGTKH